MQDILYDLLEHTPMQARLTGGDHAMREDGTRRVFYIIGDDIGPAAQGSKALSGTIERQGTARAHAQFDAVMNTGRAYQLDNISLDSRLDAHPANQLLQVLQPVCTKDRRQILQGLLFLETAQNEPFL